MKLVAVIGSVTSVYLTAFLAASDALRRARWVAMSCRRALDLAPDGVKTASLSCSLIVVSTLSAICAAIVEQPPVNWIDNDTAPCSISATNIELIASDDCVFFQRCYMS